MAETETLGFKVEINGIEGTITSLKDYKAALKAATDAQVSAGLKFGENSAQFKKSAETVNNLRSKMDDLNQTFKNTASGSGIERVNNSLGTLREGIANADFGKFKAGLQGIGQAMSAIPIFLLVNGLQLLIENFGSVMEFGKKFLNLYSQEERAVMRLTAELEEQKAKTALLSKEIDRELQIMEAQGASHDKITAKKKELIKAQIDEAIATAKLNIAKAQEVMNNDSLYESYLRVNAQVLRKIGLDQEAEKIEKVIALNKAERNKENIKAVNDSIELIKDLQTKGKVEEIKLDKETHDNWVKLQDEKRQRYLDDLAWKQKKKAEEDAWELQSEKDLQAMKSQQQQESISEAERLQNERLVESANKELEAQEKAKQEHEEYVKGKQAFEEQAINATHNLATAVGDLALARAKGNANKELQIRKTMFNVDKAFNVARTVQDGIRSVQAALTIPPPFGQILAVINGAAAAVNVAKILATKFDGGSISADSGGGGASIPSGGSTPNIGGNITTAVPNVAPQQVTHFDDNGRNLDIKATLVETEQRKVTKRIDKYNAQAEF